MFILKIFHPNLLLNPLDRISTFCQICLNSVYMCAFSLMHKNTNIMESSLCFTHIWELIHKENHISACVYLKY